MRGPPSPAGRAAFRAKENVRRGDHWGVRRRKPPADLVLNELEALYRVRYPAFVRVVTGIVGSEETARDAVHDGFVRAVRHRGRFRASGSLEGWVWRIVVNEGRKARRREGRTVVVPVATTSSNGHREVDDIRPLLAALPDRQRTALFLRYYADLDYHGIAEALGVKPGTVAATLNAAHAALRRRLEEVER
jgi:RNA polymerase sigma factor (sigma-70 family)